jgi:hypothetical protein
MYYIRGGFSANGFAVAVDEIRSPALGQMPPDAAGGVRFHSRRKCRVLRGTRQNERPRWNIIAGHFGGSAPNRCRSSPATLSRKRFSCLPE